MLKIFCHFESILSSIIFVLKSHIDALMGNQGKETCSEGKLVALKGFKWLPLTEFQAPCGLSVNSTP